MVLELGMTTQLFPESNRANVGFGAEYINWTDVGEGIVPIGGLVPWLKTFVNGTPSAVLLPNYLECNGQVIDDGDSPLDGLTLPNLNGDNKFLRGNSSSGGTGGESTHTITVAEMPAHRHLFRWYASTRTGSGYIENLGSGNADNYNNSASLSVGESGGNAAHENKPPYYNVVWVIRIK